MAKVNLFNQVRDFVEKINEAGGKPLYELTPEEARGVLRGVQEAEPDVERKEAEIEVGGGRMMRLEITKPKGVTGELGVIYYIHGGGWVMGDNITHRRLVAELAADIPAAVVFPIYTPAPEGQFPEVVEDLFKALEYIASHGDKYGRRQCRREYGCGYDADGKGKRIYADDRFPAAALSGNQRGF